MPPQLFVWSPLDLPKDASLSLSKAPSTCAPILAPPHTSHPFPTRFRTCGRLKKKERKKKKCILAAGPIGEQSTFFFFFFQHWMRLFIFFYYAIPGHAILGGRSWLFLWMLFMINRDRDSRWIYNPRWQVAVCRQWSSRPSKGRDQVGMDFLKSRSKVAHCQIKAVKKK